MPKPGRELLLGLSVFAGSLTLLLVRFLVPRPVGVPDNGDGFRVLCSVGIPPQPAPDTFVRFRYDVAATGCDPTTYVNNVLSQSWLARIAQELGHLVGLRTSLHLVLLGALSCVLVASGITAVVLGLRLSLRNRLIVAALLLLVVADSAFFGYFASVLGEGAAFLGILLAAGGLLLVGRGGWWGYAGLAVTLVGGTLAVNAKVQTLMILPLLAIAVLLVRPGCRRGLARWVPAVLTIVALAGITVVAQDNVNRIKLPDGTETRWPGDESKEINAFNSIFLTIVDGRHDSAADLAALGLPASFARYAGNGWWHPDPATRDPAYVQYRDRITRGNVARYFLEHPGRTIAVLDRAATDLLTARPDYLASFAASAGLPAGAREYRVPVFSSLTRFIAPLGLFVLVPLWVLIAFAALRHRRALGVATGLLLTIALGQFVLAALGDGLENVKHQVIALFCTLTGLVFAIATFLPRPAGNVGKEDQA